MDSNLMHINNDVCSHQFRPRSSMINDVCSHQFRPRSSMTNDVCSHQFRPRSSMTNDVCSHQFRPRSSMKNDYVHSQFSLALPTTYGILLTILQARSLKERKVVTSGALIVFKEEKFLVFDHSYHMDSSLVSMLVFCLSSVSMYHGLYPDTLFCPMFDKYFNPSPSVAQPVLEVLFKDIPSTRNYSWQKSSPNLRIEKLEFLHEKG
ncbi:hypothetical protein Tco_0603817 [Tanacetum coccineum]